MKGFLTMLMIFFTVLMAISIGSAFWLVVLNRNSEKIVTAAVPLAFAALVALYLIFWFAREQPMTRVFPVSFSFQVADKLPLSIPDRPTLEQLFFVDEIRQRDPKALEEKPDAHGLLIYHELLQKSLVDWIASRHFGHWRMELLRFEAGPGAGTQAQWSPTPDANKEKSKVLSVDDLQRIFSQNRFAGVHMGPGTLALPPGTTLNVETPKEISAIGKIRFKNKHCTMTIETSPSMGQLGLGGYSRLLGIPSSTSGYWTQQYIVRINVTFSHWFVGHPRMALIKQWASGIVDGLQNEFDEQVVWRRTVENYTLRQHLPPEIRNFPMPFGPMRSAPSAQNNKSR
jgi:hypothetical protein